MIFGNINNLEEFPFLEEQVKECFEYAKEHNLASFVTSLEKFLDSRFLDFNRKRTFHLSAKYVTCNVAFSS